MTETVERHGIRWRFRGIPLDVDDPSRGVVQAEEWREEDLTPEQMAEVDALVAEHLQHRPQDSEMAARWGILEHNGIAHRHRWGPLPDRIVGRRCAMCDVWEIPKAI